MFLSRLFYYNTIYKSVSLSCLNVRLCIFLFYFFDSLMTFDYVKSYVENLMTLKVILADTRAKQRGTYSVESHYISITL